MRTEESIEMSSSRRITKDGLPKSGSTWVFRNNRNRKLLLLKERYKKGKITMMECGIYSLFDGGCGKE